MMAQVLPIVHGALGLTIGRPTVHLHLLLSAINAIEIFHWHSTIALTNVNKYKHVSDKG